MTVYTSSDDGHFHTDHNCPELSSSTVTRLEHFQAIARDLTACPSCGGRA